MGPKSLKNWGIQSDMQPAGHWPVASDISPVYHIDSNTAKTKCRQFETNIPRKGISGPQSQFPQSCVCERIIYSHDGSAFSAGGNMCTDPGNI
jgi:hypothetical protein